MAEPRKGNVPKAQSYRLAWEIIKKSIESDFPLEAITIEESIISDRLNSFCESLGEKTRDTDTLGCIIGRLRKQSSCKSGEESKLLKRVLSWYKRRCKCIHGIVRSNAHKFTVDARAASPKVPAHQFYYMAKRCSEDGNKLARDVCQWSNRKIRAAKNMTQATSSSSIDGKGLNAGELMA